MTKTLVNQTLAIVREEAALLVEHFPHRNYQDVMGNAGLKQELMAYVLSRIPNTYAVQGTDAQARGFTTAQRLQIETLLQQGMQYILAHPSEEATPSLIPAGPADLIRF